MNEVLSIENVSLRFGGLSALSDLSLTLRQGELLGLIGPNGAGKTSVFNLLSGIYQPDEGLIVALGRPTAGLKPHQITDLGLTRTFQNIRLFKSLSVRDNIKVAFHHEAPYGLWGALLCTAPCAMAEMRFEERAQRLMELLGLQDRADQEALSLPYGEQKKLEIARAVATGARILLLDEPAAGMNAQESAWLMQAIQGIKAEFGLSILLIEHDMQVVMGICERIVVLDHGVMIAQGAPAEIRADERVIEAYLGSKRH